ncbi:MAG: starch synthase [Oceanicoccus sp.]|jgi:starch synthase
MNIVMLAAENDALPHGKVGGIGDVVRDIPPALAALGHQVHVITPGYQAFSRLPGAERVASFSTNFGGRLQAIELFRVPAKSATANVTLWALEHPLFAIGGDGQIYCNDASNRPFATDASKFALFCAAAGSAIIDNHFGDVDVLHLHDWHAAMLAVLRAFDPGYKALQKIDTVYTIHNLALQGVRPLADDESSLHAWFPSLQYNAELITDPHAKGCINPMRAGINLSGKVHAVSPSYAKEILRASDYQQGFFGGEGLEADLQTAEDEGRLYGILNGCEYPPRASKANTLQQLLSIASDALLPWLARQQWVDSAHLIADKRLQQLKLQIDQQAPAFIATSVGRITAQKVRLLQQPLKDGVSALDHLLTDLGEQGLFILLGSGDADYEQFLCQVAARHSNFLFLKGYSEAVSQILYDCGDLFIMPSSFEPCGISQMLAMRAGQPCLVHSVGGLADTVIDGKTGFAFSGNSLEQQAENMNACFKKALSNQQRKTKKWHSITQAAAKRRFLWADIAKQYVEELY